MSIQLYNVSDILKTFQIPDFQRVLDPTRVQEIKQTYLSYYTMDRYFPWGLLTFCQLHNKHHVINEFYLIDGQHRWSAIKELTYEHPDKAPKQVSVQILHCTNSDDMISYFQLIGKSKEIPSYIINSDPKTKIHHMMKELESHIASHYQPFLSKSLKPREPNINLSVFMDHLSEHVSSIPNIAKEESLITLFEKANQIWSEKIKLCPKEYEKIEKKKKKDHGLYIWAALHWWSCLENS
jgi:hypothetical protein